MSDFLDNFWPKIISSIFSSSDLGFFSNKVVSSTPILVCLCFFMFLIVDLLRRILSPTCYDG